MGKQNDGGPAFPCEQVTRREYGSPSEWRTYKGMTLRDWFAGQALVGIALLDTTMSFDDDAVTCYKFADAMLKAREQ
jgi:hypothetical protein